MRETYHHELDAIGELVITLTTAVAVLMRHATTALLDADLTLADDVMSGNEQIHHSCVEINERCFDLIATQAPGGN